MGVDDGGEGGQGDGLHHGGVGWGGQLGQLARTTTVLLGQPRLRRHCWFCCIPIPTAEAKIKVKSVLVVNVERGSHVTPDRSANRQVNVASDNLLKQQRPG